MSKHNGQIVENIVRKANCNLSDLANTLSINRRTLYNWFNQKTLKQEYILHIGSAIGHDFSKEFPELFRDKEFQKTESKNLVQAQNVNTDADFKIWQLKYIKLLEENNAALERMINNKFYTNHSSAISADQF